jgi:hypothetical protein
MPAASDHFLDLARAILGHGNLDRRPTVQLGMRCVQEPPCLGFVPPSALGQGKHPCQPFSLLSARRVRLCTALVAFGTI